jgi:hypothetical protein
MVLGGLVLGGIHAARLRGCIELDVGGQKQR